jgi:hypothetical protein
MITLQTNAAEFARELTRRAARLQNPLQTVLVEQARLAVRDAIALTPPFGPTPFSEGPRLQRQLGQNAVRRDIARAFRWTGDTQIRDPKLRDRIRHLTRRGDVAAIQAIFDRIGIRHTVARDATVAAHTAQRDRRGQIRDAKRAQYILSRPSITRLLRDKLAAVGKAKAGWTPAARALGAPVPAYIAAQPTAGQGTIEIRLTEQDPSITIGNQVPYIQARGIELGILDAIIRNRARNMAAQAERALQAAATRS